MPSSSREMLAIRAIRSAVRTSRAVQVGDLNMTVSEMMAVKGITMTPGEVYYNARDKK